MSNDAEYKPIKLTTGKAVNYAAILKKPIPVNKDVVIKQSSPGAELAKLGIKGETTVTYKKDENGNILLDKAGQPITITQFRPTEIPAFFTKAIAMLNGQEPCYFEGCDKIVESFQKELAILEAKPGGCRNCERGHLQRTYVDKLRNILPAEEANKLAKPIIPAYKIVNRETNTITVSPRKEGSYTSIRREVPKATLETFTKKANEHKLIVNGQEITYHGNPEHAQIRLTEPTGQPGNPSTGGNS